MIASAFRWKYADGTQSEWVDISHLPTGAVVQIPNDVSIKDIEYAYHIPRKRQDGAEDACARGDLDFLFYLPPCGPVFDHTPDMVKRIKSIRSVARGDGYRASESHIAALEADLYATKGEREQLRGERDFLHH